MTLALSVVALTLFQGAAPGGSPSYMPVLFQFGLIFLIFYFLMIRPQQQQRKRHEQALRQLRRGDRVVTAGGIIGEVIHIKEAMVEGQTKPTMDDEVTIKSAESRFINERGRIAKVISATGTSVAPAEKSKPGNT